MATTPWLTSDDIIAYVKRSISLPIYQNTFSEEDILAFATKELISSQVPSVLTYHEEYYVSSAEILVQSNKVRYPIPNRAIGMKLRDIKYKDVSGNLYEMARIAPDDKAFFANKGQSNSSIYAFYLEGNDIVLLPSLITVADNTYLKMYYFQRPNNLVKNDRACSIKYFTKTITVDNSTLVAGDEFLYNGVVFEAVAAAPTGNQFLIGATSTDTALNLSVALANSQLVLTTVASAVVTVKYLDIEDTLTSNLAPGLLVQTGQGVELNESTAPANIANGSYVDILERQGGHRILNFDVRLGISAVSGNTLTFGASDLPTTTKPGDLICTQYESIIPYLPDDLHYLLAERTAAEILVAQNDQAGLQITKQKIAEMEQAQGAMIDNRVESEVIKVFNKASLLRLGKIFPRRSW